MMEYEYEQYKNMNTEAYLKPTRTSTMEHLCENN